jgi:hypothetical protein
MAAKKTALGDSGALSSVVPGVIKEPGRQVSREKRVRKRLTITMDPALLEEAKNTVMTLSGPPAFLNLSSMIEEAVRAEVKRLEEKYNSGKPFEVLDNISGHPLGRAGRKV